MSRLTFEKFLMPAACLSSQKSPLPQLNTLDLAGSNLIIDKSVSSQDSKYFGYGSLDNCLPYRVQGDYDRDRKPRNFKVAVLENEILRATFLMELGGRLWSLFHKPSNRELLYGNPVFQPGNLAIRNAWFAGGVEWNAGVIGHSPFTCSAPFFASLDHDGTPVLRMYEWERARSAPYQVDFFLPNKSPLLYVRVKLINPNDFEIPAYWWSNMGLKASEGIRVLAPADQIFYSHLDPNDNFVEMVPVPVCQGKDITYPENNVSAHDYYFRIPDDQRPWETALDGRGIGLVHVSTATLKGRKLFVWGTSPGGKRWQELLSEPGNPYVEIQAGLCRTQLECRPMAANSRIEWLEGYGLIEADADIVHGDDWDKALSHIEGKLDALASLESLEEKLKSTKSMSNTAPQKIIQKGSGWGELEIKRRDKYNSDVFDYAALSFVGTIGSDQQPWLMLLEDGYLPERSPEEFPGGYMTQKEWTGLLEESVRTEKGDHWFSYLHLGVMYYSQKDYEKAEKAWLISIEKTANCWAYRNLAGIYRKQGEIEKAVEMFDCACELNISLPELIIEYGEFLIGCQKYDKLKSLLGGLNKSLLDMPRVRLFQAQLYIVSGRLSEAEVIFHDIELVDVRECENTLTEMWHDLQKKKLRISKKDNPKTDDLPDLPSSIDFRMKFDEI